MHELVHKVRGGKTGRLEEAIAVKAGYKLALKARIRSGINKLQLPGILNLTWKANGIKIKPLDVDERKYVKEEVNKTIKRIDDLLKEKGYSLQKLSFTKMLLLIILI